MAEKSVQEALASHEKMLQTIAKDVHSIKRRLLISTVGSYLRLVIFLIPLVFAFVYLPPLLRDFWKQYGSILGAAGNVSGVSPMLEGQSKTAIDEILDRMDPEQLNTMLRSLR